MNLEHVCTSEKYEWDISSRKTHLNGLEMQQVRFLRLKEENEQLMSTYHDMSQELSDMYVFVYLCEYQVNIK